jgi:hypothetical protein
MPPVNGKRGDSDLEFHQNLLPVEGEELLQNSFEGVRERIGISPDYSRCVGVDLEKACFNGILLQVCSFDRSPTI